LLATTSNDELGQDEDKMAPLFVVEVYQGELFRVSFVPEGVPHIIGCIRQVCDTPQVL